MENTKNSFTKEILKYNEILSNIDKSVIVSNILKYLCLKYPECENSSKSRMQTLEEITGENQHTVYSWINLSREKVKTPFLKLCNLAVALDVDIGQLLETDNEDNIDSL